MSSAARLYTPDMLALAMELARWPIGEGFGLQGEARSATCGSTIMLQLDRDATGAITTIGLQVRACAVGQAAAAIFARHAAGRTERAITDTLTAMEAWLSDDAPMPDWPDLALIAAARDFPGRHGAMLLPWRAAAAALSKAAAPR
jgi:NifU-like protein involved in Fe-S cluster formation